MGNTRTHVFHPFRRMSHPRQFARTAHATLADGAATVQCVWQLFAHGGVSVVEWPPIISVRPEPLLENSCIYQQCSEPADGGGPAVVGDEVGATRLLAKGEEATQAEADGEPQLCQPGIALKEEEVESQQGKAAGGVAAGETLGGGQVVGAILKQQYVWPVAAIDIELPRTVGIADLFAAADDERGTYQYQHHVGGGAAVAPYAGAQPGED